MGVRSSSFRPVVALNLIAVLSLTPGLAAAGVSPPPNDPGKASLDPATGRLTFDYDGSTVLDVMVKGADGSVPKGLHSASEVRRGPRESVEARLRIFAEDGAGEVTLQGKVLGSAEAFPAETRSAAQDRFPCVRNAVGLSRSLRNNAVYDRRRDWVLIGPADGRTRLIPLKAAGERVEFSWESRGPEIEIFFRPRFYALHRNLRYFEPWTRPVRNDSIAGWCSWWAYRADFTAKDLAEVLEAFAAKRLGDFGYRFIQIDDAYQGGSGTPESWLRWSGKFPEGMGGYVSAVRAKGLEPAVWVSVSFRDEATVRAHPGWFVRGADGKPHRGPWIEYGIDATVPGAAGALVRPTYRGFREAGFTYVKIDTLRHLLYDSLHRVPEYGRDRGLSGDDVFRRYLAIAREELGPETFILACWGVIPEAIGFADGCRLGTDGFGPATLQQYNSWNGVVWRNDPDHCDVLGGSGTVADSILRPTIVSMAGGVLMLSDRPEVYRRDEVIEGAKRSVPILPTVPGQLYDYDPSKSDWFLTHERAEVKDGGPPSPADARQMGDLCPWWVLEIERPFESWTVLARYNWTKEAMPEVLVRFADIGLPADGEQLVYEFWTRRFLGAFRDGFRAEELPPASVRMYAIRRKLDVPQVVSTSRHISQGGPDILEAGWKPGTRTLAGRSAVVEADPYAITIHAPDGFRIRGATIDGAEAPVRREGRIATLTFTPKATGTIAWGVAME